MYLRGTDFMSSMYLRGTGRRSSRWEAIAGAQKVGGSLCRTAEAREVYGPYYCTTHWLGLRATGH